MLNCHTQYTAILSQMEITQDKTDSVKTSSHKHQMNAEEMGSISLQYFQIRLQKKSSLTKINSNSD